MQNEEQKIEIINYLEKASVAVFLPSVYSFSNRIHQFNHRLF